jgi:hypothetical protein
MGDHGMAEVECEDLTADESAILAAIVEINEGGQLILACWMSCAEKRHCRRLSSRTPSDIWSTLVSWKFRGNGVLTMPRGVKLIEARLSSCRAMANGKSTASWRLPRTPCVLRS